MVEIREWFCVRAGIAYKGIKRTSLRVVEIFKYLDWNVDHMNVLICQKTENHTLGIGAFPST